MTNIEQKTPETELKMEFRTSHCATKGRNGCEESSTRAADGLMVRQLHLRDSVTGISIMFIFIETNFVHLVLVLYVEQPLKKLKIMRTLSICYGGKNPSYLRGLSKEMTPRHHSHIFSSFLSSKKRSDIPQTPRKQGNLIPID